VRRAYGTVARRDFAKSMSKKENFGREYANQENKFYRATRLSPQTKNRGTKNIRKAKKSK
jgi:hypothetical protein